MTFCIQRKGFVQILYNEVRLTVASVSNGIDEPVVNVYDSLFHTASSHTKKQIACIVNTAYPRIKLNFMDVTCQNGSDDCGLFAATTICYGKIHF